MIAASDTTFSPHAPSAPPAPSSRASFAARRSLAARASLACCRLCAHDCRADRRDGPAGKCHAGPFARVFSAQTEVADELALGPTFAIALSGCDLRCDFCITGRESWDARAGKALAAAALATRARAAVAAGARTIMILGGEPTVHLPDALEIVAHLPDSARLAWKTNAHGSPVSRTLLDGIFDVWVADFKFGNDACAARLARTPDYLAPVRANLLWAARAHELIIRHLLMPGHVECCWHPVAAWLATHLPDAKVSLREGFWPAWRAHIHPELHGPASAAEVALAHHIAADHGLNLIA
jgi:putative pyruvate formate lyase activating enzyme